MSSWNSCELSQYCFNFITFRTEAKIEHTTFITQISGKNKHLNLSSFILDSLLLADFLVLSQDKLLDTEPVGLILCEQQRELENKKKFNYFCGEAILSSAVSKWQTSQYSVGRDDLLLLLVLPNVEILKLIENLSERT